MKNSNLSSESLMMSFGYNASEHQGSVKCPLFQTSTFVFKTAEEGKAFFEIAYGLREKQPDEQLGMIYSRLDNPNLSLAEKRLALWDGGEDALFFASGMAGISTVALTFLKPGDVLLYTSPVYGGTEHLFNHVLPQFGIEAVKFYDCDDFDSIVCKLGAKKPGLIYAEIPGNPTNTLIDMEICVRLANHFAKNGTKPPIVVDNTFLGPVFQHPLQLGADISLYSATKFIGGHSDVVAGACVGSSEWISPIRTMRTFLGSMLDPHSSWLILRSLETLKVRMEQQAKSAAKVAAYLRTHPQVAKLYYLGFLDDSPADKAIFERQCTSPGSMISFEIKGGEKEAFRFLNNLKLFKLAVSLGSTESLAEHPATMTHADVSADEKERLGINERLIRLSIGLENADDLIKAIEKAFGV
ncbi:MAG: cystathionine gamma-synthase family protein [Cytophagaceae bacterium]|jgi:methionine-gamma-lyase|nr:cystathionine gamma-synthase family protein [Cytophagaceae bacterium]